MNLSSEVTQHPTRSRDELGHPAHYWFAGQPEPVRFLGVHRGQPIVIRSDGRLEVVNAERVRLLPCL